MQIEGRGESKQTLRDECRVFTRYLVSAEPDDYLLDKYIAMQSCVMTTQHQPRLDTALLALGRLGIFGTRIADAYARFCLPGATLRRKLILVLALAENSRAFHRLLTSGGSGRASRDLLSVAVSVTAFSIALILGLVLFTPLRLLPRRANAEPSR